MKGKRVSKIKKINFLENHYLLAQIAFDKIKSIPSDCYKEASRCLYKLAIEELGYSPKTSSIDVLAPLERLWSNPNYPDIAFSSFSCFHSK